MATQLLAIIKADTWPRVRAPRTEGKRGRVREDEEGKRPEVKKKNEKKGKKRERTIHLKCLP